MCACVCAAGGGGVKVVEEMKGMGDDEHEVMFECDDMKCSWLSVTKLCTDDRSVQEELWIFGTKIAIACVR